MPAAFNKSAFDCSSTDNIKNYFAQMNPIAEQISRDICDTQEAYGLIWHALSFQDQSDIIDETLIKPEIALRYIENISSPTSPLPNDNRKKIWGCSTFSYDGQNLKAFAIQKVAFKSLQDDTIAAGGINCDEHASLPFSYKTKSQTNLQLLTNSADQQTQGSINKTPKAIFLNSAANSLNTVIPHLPQIKLKTHRLCNISNNYNEERAGNVSVYNLRPESDRSNLSKNKIVNKKSLFNLQPHENIITTSQSVYGDDPYIEIDECSRLVLGNSELMLASSSAATSDDDEDKTLYEDVRLLDSECTTALNKGFDFLNNW